MHPILVNLWLPFIGHFPLHTFGVMVALGSFLAILYIRRESLRRGFDKELLMGIAVETLLVGVAGSRLLFILITPKAFEGKSLLAYVNIREGGLVWYGGLVPAAAFAIWRARQLGLPFRTIADIIAPAVMLGLSIGRIGCLCAGDDYGKPVDGDPWWALTFQEVRNPDGTLAPPHAQPLMNPEFIGRPLWPSQPLMGIGAFAIFLVTHLLRKRLAPRPAALAWLMFGLYAIHRFLVEFTRGDDIRGHLGPLSTSQWIGIPVLLLSAGILAAKLRGPPPGVEAAVPPSAPADAEKKGTA